MIFYLVPAANGFPPRLEGTQADANRVARERELKVRAPDMEHQVPTDKAGLMQYVNELLRDKHAVQSRAQALEAFPPEPSEDRAETDDEMGIDISELAARDGAFAGDVHLTPAFTPRPKPQLHPSMPTVDLMCEMIDDGKVDARGMTNLFESITHRTQKMIGEVA